MNTLAWGLGWLFGLPLFILGVDAAGSRLLEWRRSRQFAALLEEREAAGRQGLLSAMRSVDGESPRAGERRAR